jgi:DNA polymerase-3 subunit delta'
MGALWVCADKDAGLRYLLSLIPDKPRVVFEAQKEEFSVAEARSLIAAAFVASDREKFLIASAAGYGREAQNALLKLLEEPPKNITIYLLAANKSVFLPTVRSRLPIYVIPSPKPPNENLIDFAKLDLKAVYEFLKNNAYLPRDRAKKAIEEIFDYFTTLNPPPPLKKRVLEAIERGFKALALNSSAAAAILPVLLLLLECRDDTKTAV